MPAVLSQYDVMGLERREWRNTVGQSGMTPTAFAFLVPVFVVVFFAPFLCVFCVRRRQRNTPAVPLTIRKVKKPALRRAEARERLTEFTEVADVSDIANDRDASTPKEKVTTTSTEETPIPITTTTSNIEPSTPIADTASVSERECAICLSTLHAPSPPAPALIPQPSLSTPLDEAATHPPPTSSSDPEPILKLHSCSHAFHAECLVSWFVLRKTTCPICRTQYISTEDMKAYEDAEAAEMEQMSLADEEAGRVLAAQEQQTSNVSNWRYFWAGQSVMGREAGGEGNGNGNGARGWRVWRRG
ncbi:hypothetical protein DE146DRAFT_738102 [Phaeosphaeria sp. MPI-PUGE-AT-0046c]|nr:hypothetical protein DE146DRAFT_738102 [Phaeosphaeria sp. MPI-PUGE-AT-0046c]